MGRGRLSRTAILAGLAVTGLSVGDSAGSAAEAMAQIAVAGDESTGMLTISASVLAHAATTVSGELVVSRKGAAGVVSTRQARDFVLAAGDTGTIAELGISYSPADSLDIVAIVYRGGVAISRATLSTSAPGAPLSGGSN